MCYAMTASPSTYPYNEDGSFSSNFPALNGANPIQTETYNYNRATINRFLGSMAATWTIWDNLKLKEAISYDFNQTMNVYGGIPAATTVAHQTVFISALWATEGS